MSHYDISAVSTLQCNINQGWHILHSLKVIYQNWLHDFRSVNFEISFWCLQFFQKMDENNSTWGIIVVRSNCFVCCLEELRIPRSPFEINWPLWQMYYTITDYQDFRMIQGMSAKGFTMTLTLQIKFYWSHCQHGENIPSHPPGFHPVQ